MHVLAELSGVEQFFIAVAAGLVLAILGAFAHAGVQTYNKRVEDREKAEELDRQKAEDFDSFSQWFFGNDENPRTHQPGRQGEYDLILRRLADLEIRLKNQKDKDAG